MQKGDGPHTRPIVRIAILGIILGVAVMILSVVIVRGFRTEIRDKVVGFNAHIQVSDLSNALGSDAHPILQNDSLLQTLSSTDGVKEVRPYLDRPAILESKDGIDGIIAKGLIPGDSTFYLAGKLVEGHIPDLPDSAAGNGLLLSKYLADRAEVSLGDRVSLYFLGQGESFSTRRLEVSGIYSTDLEDFDKQYVYLDIRHLQKVMARGLEVQVLVSDTCKADKVMVEARGFGGGRKTFFWSNGMMGAGPYGICPAALEDLSVILKDDMGTVPDTAFITFYPGKVGSCGCDGLSYDTRTSGGSYGDYISGYELTLDDFSTMPLVKEQVESEIGPFLYCSDIIERTPEIFSWLELLDVNIYIIIILMVGVAVVNMSSALIITIIERSKMIGVLKAMGADNASVRSIFIRHAARLIGVGLILGNVLGLGLAVLQMKFGIIQLQAENYYLSEVPILIHWQDILLIDLGTLSICLLAMTIPSLLITRISPVRAIRFD